MLKVTVAGATKTGKTTLALAIAAGLQEFGLPVTVKDEDGALTGDYLQQQTLRLAALREKGLPIEVETVTVIDRPRIPDWADEGFRGLYALRELMIYGPDLSPGALQIILRAELGMKQPEILRQIEGLMEAQFVRHNGALGGRARLQITRAGEAALETLAQAEQRHRGRA